MIRLLLLCLLPLVAFAADTPWPLRWRVTADTVNGLAFRHPYELIPSDLGSTGLVRIDPQTRRYRTDPEVRLFVRDGADPRQAGEAEAGGTVAWAPWTPSSSTAPTAAGTKKEAPLNAVLGTLGAGPHQRTVLAIAQGSRTVGLVLRGGPTTGDNAGILASVEVLPPAAKGKPAPATARDLAARKGTVLDSTGKPVPARTAAKPVGWPQAWELETEHYHLTGNTSPARLAWHGQYLEALYRTYAGIYQPERMPPTKFEVHLFHRQEEFHAAANAWGNDLPPMGNGILGGFFSPSLQSLWVYEESGALGGPDMTIEHVIAHECSHQFLFLATHGNHTVPTWLNEGLAVYFESGVFQNGCFEIRPPSGRLAQLKTLYQQRGNTLVPLEDYIAHQGSIGPDQYGEVFAMTHFWLFGACKGPQCPHKNCGLSRFRTYWNDLKAGADGPQAFEDRFMADMIKAKGGRDQALSAWKAAHLEYVKTLK